MRFCQPVCRNLHERYWHRDPDSDRVEIKPKMMGLLVLMLAVPAAVVLKGNQTAGTSEGNVSEEMSEEDNKDASIFVVSMLTLGAMIFPFVMKFGPMLAKII